MKSLLSGRIGEPTGAFTRLSNKQTDSAIERAVNFIVTNEQNIQDVLDSTGAVDAPWARIDSDGSIIASGKISSASRVAEGIYDVTTSVSYQTDGTNPQFSVQVTPQGLVTTPTESQIDYYKVLTTVSTSPNLMSMFLDTVKGKVWCIDEDHANLSGETSDRIAVFRADSETTEYIYFPSGYPLSDNTTQGSALIPNFTNRVVYAQALTAAGKNCTLIYDMDTLDLLFNTWADISHGQTNDFMIVGHDEANETMLIRGDSNLYLYSMSSGLPDSQTDFEAFSTYNATFPLRYAINDENSGDYWFHNDNATPDEFLQISGVDLATFTDHATDATDEADTLVYTYRKSTREIFFMGASKDTLYKISTASPYTVTQVYSGTYPTRSGGNELTSIKAATTIFFSADEYRLIAVCDATPVYIYVVDPSDGVVEQAYSIPDTYTVNFHAIEVGIDYGVIWSMASERIVKFTYGGGEASTATLVYRPVTAAARPTSVTTARIELFETGNAIVRRDNAFNITFHGQLA